MASHRPSHSEDFSDALSTSSDVSSVDELPATGVPLRYPSPTPVDASDLKGVVCGQAAFPPPIAPQGFLPAIPPSASVYPAIPQCTPPDYTEQNKEGREAGRPAHVSVVIPRLPLDTLHRPKKAFDGDAHEKLHAKAASEKYVSGFVDKRARVGFLRTVLWIVLLQMAGFSALSAVLLFVTSSQEFLAKNEWIIWISWCTVLGLVIFGRFAFNRIRRFPNNLLFLLTLTAALGSSIAFVVGRFESESLFLTVILASSLVLFLASIASVTNVDVTNWVPLLMSSFVVVFSAAVIGALWLNAVFSIVLAATGAMVWAMYVVYDVQTLLADHNRSLAPDEYIAGACAVYVDILNIFRGCLSLFKVPSNGGLHV